MSEQPPPAPTASAVDPCPTTIQISRRPRHWKFTQYHRNTRPSPKLSLNGALGDVHCRGSVDQDPKGGVIRVVQTQFSSFYLFYILNFKK